MQMYGGFLLFFFVKQGVNEYMHNSLPYQKQNYGKYHPNLHFQKREFSRIGESDHLGEKTYAEC